MSSATPSDHEFRYLGMTERQIRLLDGESNEMRRIVYDEQLVQLMESGPGYGDHSVTL